MFARNGARPPLRRGARMILDNATPYPANFTMAFDRNGHEQIVVVAKASFGLTDGAEAPCRTVADQPPLIEADVFGADPATDATLFETDFAAVKPFCDILCSGDACAPGGRPATETAVGIRVGGWTKKFTVHGSRIWLKAAAGFRPSDKRPFLRQPIGYDHAYGGTDPDPADPARAATFEENPVGLGYYPLRPDREGAPLAHTSEFGQDPTGIAGGQAPMAFGPVGRNWLPRRRYAGTYDEAWTDNRMPFLPHDFQDRYFQAAAEDQQIPYPKGGERVELVNLSPGGRIATSLPRLQIVVLFARKSGRLTQRIANLDTILLMPGTGLLSLTFRARLTAERDIFEFARATITARGPEGVSDG